MLKNSNSDVRLKEPKGKKRSSKWRSVRKAFLKKHPRCAVCGGNVKVEVHHIIPFFLRPDLELDRGNLITLCEGKKTINCHCAIGHGCNYKDFNPDVVKDAEHFHDLITNWQIVELEKTNGR